MCDLSASIFLMNRSFYCVEIFILMILYYIGGNSPPKSIFKCSRIKSRLVRLIINKRVSPVLNRYKLNFPLTCPFHNDRDILWWPDIQFHFQDGQWICPYCGQIFPSEITLTEHWDSEHMDNEIEDAVCLANFCDIFRCEVILAALEVEKNTYAWEKISKFQYPLNRAPCDEKKMRSLQKKCKVIMRHCLLGLLSSLSTKDFQDIEDEIGQAICSYLTCKKYSDGSLQVVKPVPALIIVIVLSVLIGGFTLCYYVVYSMSSYPGSFINNELLYNGAAQSRIYAQQYNEYIHRKNKNKMFRRR